MPAHHSSAAACASSAILRASADGMHVRARYSGTMKSGRISSSPSTVWKSASSAASCSCCGARVACLARSAASTGLSSEKQMYTVAQLQKRCITERSCSCWWRQSSSTSVLRKRLLSWCRSLPVTAEMLYRCTARWISVWHTDIVKVCSSLWWPWWSTVLSRSNAMSDRRVSRRCARSRGSSSRASSNGGWRSKLALEVLTAGIMRWRRAVQLCVHECARRRRKTAQLSSGVITGDCTHKYN